MKSAWIVMVIVALAVPLLPVRAGDDPLEQVEEICKHVNPPAHEIEGLGNLLASIDNRKKLQTAVHIMVRDGMSHVHPDVVLGCYNALATAGANVRDALAEVAASRRTQSEAKKARPTIPYVLMLDLLCASDNPEHWRAGIKYITMPDRALSTVAIELAGQGLTEAVPDIIKTLKSSRGQKLRITLDVLEFLTEGKVPKSRDRYIDWWKDNKKTFDTDRIVKRPEEMRYFKKRFKADGSKADGSKDEGISYYGLKMKPGNVYFVMDTSFTMNPDVLPKTPKYETSSEASDFPPLPKGNDSRIWGARLNLARAVRQLDERYKFGIITFGGRVDEWGGYGGMQIATLANRRDADKWTLYKTRISLGTVLYQGLWTALNNPETEEIFLLTDGMPQMAAQGQLNQGNVKMREDHESVRAPWFKGTIAPLSTNTPFFDRTFINKRCRVHHLGQRVVINTIFMSMQEGGQLKDFLKEMASTCGGSYRFSKVSLKPILRPSDPDWNKIDHQNGMLKE